MSQTIASRLTAIRSEMAKDNLDAYIIPRADEYLGEYVPERNERLHWATDFTGSAGMAIVLKDKAAIFVDGRYTVQVGNQVDADLFEYCSLVDDPQIEWLIDTLAANSRIGYDSRLHPFNWQQEADTKIKQARMTLVPVDNNPIDLHWDNRPPLSDATAILFDDSLAGKTSIQKRKDIGTAITKKGADVALITDIASCAWLLNLRGNDVPRLPVILSTGLLEANGNMTLFCDLNKIIDGTSEHVGEGVTFKPASELKATLAALGGKTLLGDPATANAWSMLIAKESADQIIEGIDPVALPKAQKNETELAGIRASHIRDGVAVSRYLAWLDAEVEAGRFYHEGELSDKLASFRVQGERYLEPSFDTISAAGGNAAMCHYNHNNGEPLLMPNNSLYLVDSGAQYLDGTTDVTRTIAIGHVTEEQKQMATLVLKGHIAIAQARFPKGTSGQQLDTLARMPQWQLGFDYDHGTGHGVGHCLSVHEGPQKIAKNNNGVALLDGMVVSNEPGYYRADEFGIRLENLITVRPCNALKNAEREMFEFETLTFIPMDVRILNKDLLTQNEIDWFNDYHQEVFNKLSPLMQGDELAWLSKVTQAI